MDERIRQRRESHNEQGVDPKSTPTAIEDNDLDARAENLLDGISAAYDRARAGLKQGLAGNAIQLDDL